MTTRFAEHVCSQIRAGLWEGKNEFPSDRFVVKSVGRGNILVGNEEEWNKSWRLVARRGGLLFRKKMAFLARGSEFSLPIPQNEQDALYDCYMLAKDEQAIRNMENQQAVNNMRQRMTDWP